MEHWPQYVCAILEDSAGRLLLESRPLCARLAPGRLTCFGGRRNAGEAPEECLRRELREELNWEPQTLDKRVELWVAGELIAWFYHGAFDVTVGDLHVAPGYQALLVPQRELSDAPLSPWHAAALGAWLQGNAAIELEA